MPEELGTYRPIARKEHVCNYCGCTIPKGEQYEHSTLKYDGSIYVWKSHLDCLEAVSKFNMMDHCWDEGLSMEDFCAIMEENVLYELDPHREQTKGMNMHEKVQWALKQEQLLCNTK